jgi:hypothetical protein
LGRLYLVAVGLLSPSPVSESRRKFYIGNSSSRGEVVENRRNGDIYELAWECIRDRH